MIITSDILASSSKSTDPCQDGHDVVDGEHCEDDVDVIDVEDSEGLDLELDPLLLGRDAGHPVDLRLHQAHLALRQGRDCSKCYTRMDWEEIKCLTSSGRKTSKLGPTVRVTLMVIGILLGHNRTIG